MINGTGILLAGRPSCH